jgi:nicotinamidase/pyrazinamidase
LSLASPRISASPGQRSTRCKADFETCVVEDACRGIDTQGSLAKAWSDMDKAGVKRIQSADIVVS